MMLRRTVVVHTRLAGHAARVNAARLAAHGLQILTIERLAARLAGGFLQPIERETLQDAIIQALNSGDLGELEAIKTLPGMVGATIATLEKVWQVPVDLKEYPEKPRLQALAALEREVIRRLPSSMRRPPELVDLALARITHAKAIFGSIEVHGHSEMGPVWRPLLKALAEIVPVTWVAGPRPVPAWLDGTKIDVQRAKPESANIAHTGSGIDLFFVRIAISFPTDRPADFMPRPNFPRECGAYSRVLPRVNAEISASLSIPTPLSAMRYSAMLSEAPSPAA
jgi:hypothetical protein